MPISKGATRKGGRKDRPKRKTKQSMYEIANAVVKRNMAGDMTFLDTIQTAVSVSYDNPYVQNLCEVPQGNDQGQRQGDRIGITSFELNLQAIHSSSSTLTGMLGMALVQSLTDTAPGWGSVYYNGASQNVLSHRFPVNRGEYKVLKRWTIDLGHHYYSDKATRIIQYRKVWKKPLMVQYNGATASNTRYNALYLIATSNHLNASFPPQIFYNARINFTP